MRRVVLEPNRIIVRDGIGEDVTPHVHQIPLVFRDSLAQRLRTTLTLIFKSHNYSNRTDVVSLI